jgi:hypothetical protein
LKIFNQEDDEEGNAGKSGLEPPAVPGEFPWGFGCPEWFVKFGPVRLCRFHNAIGADAASADANRCPGSFDYRMDTVQVRQPAAPCQVMGMTDPVPGNGLLSTDFTDLCHTDLLKQSSKATHYTGTPGY